jgi:multisubunit Na+/H+ antiporter MnhE subunit
MKSDMRMLTQVVLGLAIFLFWLSLVGNPHVVETVLGLVVAIVGGWWAGRFLPKAKKEPDEKLEKDLD